MRRIFRAVNAIALFVYLLLFSKITACPIDDHASRRATTPITASDRDREVARRFAAALFNSNGSTLSTRNIITSGGANVCHSYCCSSNFLQGLDHCLRVSMNEHYSSFYGTFLLRHSSYIPCQNFILTYCTGSCATYF